METRDDCPWNKSDGQWVCRDGHIWELTYGGIRKDLGLCPHCERGGEERVLDCRGAILNPNTIETGVYHYRKYGPTPEELTKWFNSPDAVGIFPKRQQH